MEMIISVPKKKSKGWNPFKMAVRAYAEVKGSKGDLYTVIKHANIFHSVFSCTCPDHQFRRRECKHIKFMRGELRHG